MKSNFLKHLFNCAFVAGLMIFAAGKADAGTVIGGDLYTPMNLKLAVTYYDVNGKLKKMTVTSKDLLLLLGYAKNDQLSRGPGGDIYVNDSHTVLADLTTGGFLSMDFNQVLYTETHPNDGLAFTFSESGSLTVNFYSDGGADETNGHGSAFWFEVSGSYTGSGSVSAPKDNQETVKEDLKSSTLDGNGFDIDLYNVNTANSTVPVNGGVTGKGSGKILPPI